MISRIKLILKQIISRESYNLIRQFYWNFLNGAKFESYSGEGEDMILRKIFYKKSKGFYVDIGAYQPKKSSNTYYFYKKGWRGINIDAMPGSMKLFEQFRPNDINIECPIGNDNELMSYYEFEDKALNGFESEKLRTKDQSKSQNVIKRIHKLHSKSLNLILRQYLPEGQEIDFMTIDVEGNEMKVLSGINLQEYHPKWILVEIWNFEISDSFQNPVDQLLRNEGYIPMAKTINTVFYSTKPN